MSTSAPRCVFDCNVLLQAVLSRIGASYRCIELVERGDVELLISDATLEEARDVLLRSKILLKNPQVTPHRVGQFLELLARHATHLENVPRIIHFPTDPKDEPYLNLSLAGNAQFLVTRDQRHLLRMTSSEAADAQAIREHLPNLTILDPPAFLRAIETSGEKQA